MTTTATVAVTVHVTHQHIEHGRKGDCTHCPIALAILDVLPPGSVCSVSADHVILATPGRSITQPLPPGAQEFVQDFDLGHGVTPFSFEIEVPA